MRSRKGFRQRKPAEYGSKQQAVFLKSELGMQQSPAIASQSALPSFEATLANDFRLCNSDSRL